MESFGKTINPYYNKANGISVGFILYLLLFSKITDVRRKVIYFLYVCNQIRPNLLKYERNKLTKEFLLQIIFQLSEHTKLIKRKDLRELTGMIDKKTFNKYFANHIDESGLSKSRIFTLAETFQILKFWQGDDKWGRMKAYSKGELARRFMNGSYEELELKMFEIINDKEGHYKNHDFIMPVDANKFINELLDNEFVELVEEDFNQDYLSFFFYLYLSSHLINLKNKIV